MTRPLFADGLLDADRRDTCRACGGEIRMQIRRGTGLCCQRCQEAKERVPQ
jgi:hypothetical protein